MQVNKKRGFYLKVMKWSGGVHIWQTVDFLVFGNCRPVEPDETKCAAQHQYRNCDEKQSNRKARRGVKRNQVFSAIDTAGRNAFGVATDTLSQSQKARKKSA